jgi:hypothetical protein
MPDRTKLRFELTNTHDHYNAFFPTISAALKKADSSRMRSWQLWEYRSDGTRILRFQAREAGHG